MIPNATRVNGRKAVEKLLEMRILDRAPFIIISSLSLALNAHIFIKDLQASNRAETLDLSQTCRERCVNEMENEGTG